MMQNLMYLFFGLIGVFECSQFNNYYSTLNAIKNSVDLTGCEPQAIKNFELYRKDISGKLLRTRACLMLANYYINVGIDEYKDGLHNESTPPEDPCTKAARYISEFMIEYMDYEGINKYIKIQSPKRRENFGDYLKSVKATVVIKDIEKAITAYYFPELKTDTTLPLPKLRDPEGEGLQVGPQNSPEQEKQAKGKGKLRRGSKRKVRDQGNVNIRVTENEKVKKSKSQ